MPNRKAKERKQLKRKKNEWCNKYGRTAKQIARWKRKNEDKTIEETGRI